MRRIVDFESWLLERLLCDVETHCWRFQGSHGSTGYGKISHEGHPWKSPHQLAYWLWVGEIGTDPERNRALDVDHVYAWGCRYKDCCNPAHLELVTNAINVQRGAAVITHCPHGHSYDDENTYTNPQGTRFCKTCRREADRARGNTEARRSYRTHWLQERGTK